MLLLLFFFILIPSINAECFTEEKVDMGYMEINDEFDYDQNDFEVEFEDWGLELPSSTYFEKREMFYYNEVKGVRYIHLYNFLGDEWLDINEIVVKKNDEVLAYNIYCESCNDYFERFIQNGVYTQENSYININGYLRLDLGDYYSIGDLTIELYFTDYTTSEKKYELSTSRDETLDRIYTNVLERMWFTHKTDAEVMKRVWSLSNILYVNPEFTDYQVSAVEIQPTKYRSVILRNEYRDGTLMYRHYKVKRNYIDCQNNVVEEVPAIINESNPNIISSKPIPKVIDIVKEEPVIIVTRPVETNKVTQVKTEAVTESVSATQIQTPISITKEEPKLISPIPVELNKDCTKNVIIKDNIYLVAVLTVLIIVRGIIDVRNKYCR